MANTNVFFNLFAGDDNTINITVTDDAGDVVDISTVTAITWKLCASERSTTTIISKTLGSGISLIGGRTGGIFQVAIDSADSTGLDGTYYQASSITLGGDLTHVAIGTIWFRPSC